MNPSLVVLLKSRLAFGLIAITLASTAAQAVAAPRLIVRALSGARQQTTYASAFPAPLVVWVADRATDRSVSGVRVNFTAAPGIQLSSPYAITDERGLARVNVSGLVPCISRVSAELAGDPASAVSFDNLVVNKAVLTVVPANLESTAGVLPAIIGYSIHGFVNGDTQASAQITGAPALTTTATTHSRYGNYAIKGGAGSLSSPNYTFVAGFGTLAIVKGSDADLHSQEESIVVPPAGADAATVRPTLVKKLTAALISKPAYAEAVISPNHPALPNSIVNSRQSSCAPDSAILARTAISQSLTAASAGGGNRNTVSTGSAVPVRTAILPSLTAETPASPSPNAIRRALNSPAFQ